MNKKTMLKRKSGIMTADMNGATVMLDIETGKYFNLGDIGGDIWELLENEISMEALVENLMQRYQVSEEQCLKDVESFLKMLMQRGLVYKCG